MNKNILLCVILVLMCIGFGIGIGYFVLKPLEINSNIKNKVESEEEKFNIIKLSIDSCEDYDITFNGINLKIENNDEYKDDLICVIDKVIVNDKDITNFMVGDWIDSFAVLDKMVIIESGNTSSTLLTIYDANSNKLLYSLSPEKLSGYFVDSYKTENNKIIINGHLCGEQCGDKAYDFTCEEIKTEKYNIFPEAQFELEYKGNGILSDIRLIEKTSFEESNLYNKYYGDCK